MSYNGSSETMELIMTTATPDRQRAVFLAMIDANPEIAARIFRRVIEEASDSQTLSMMEMANEILNNTTVSW
jgi:hypothetical protein